MAKFADIPHFILEDLASVLTPYGTVMGTKGILSKGHNTGIVAKYGFGIDLFVLIVGEGYKRIRARHISGTPQDRLLEFHLETDCYKTSELTINELITNAGAEVYFMKGHQIDDFIDADSNYDNYVNTNKVFLYLGKIYPIQNTSKFYVTFYNMRNYAYDALPQNNRNDNIKEMFNLFFGNLHSKNHSMSKNILTLNDPFEVEERYLEYLFTMYDMAYQSDLSEYRRREYANALPALLKRTGSYSSIFIGWYNIAPFTTNYLNIYERWHDYDLVGYPNNNFKDYNYLANNMYDAALPVDGAGRAYM
jgi:hypothetical protein